MLEVKSSDQLAHGMRAIIYIIYNVRREFLMITVLYKSTYLFT